MMRGEPFPPSRVCLSIAERTPARLLEVASIQAARGERFLEFCLEMLEDPSQAPGVVHAFLRRWPGSWLLATCRRGPGQFAGSVRNQLNILQAVVSQGAKAIDLEVETAAVAQPWLWQMKDSCVRIVSYHNYTCCPPLNPIIQLLSSYPADLIKIAAATRSELDVSRVLQAAHMCRRPNIILGMGQEGLATRIVGPVIGQSFTYAHAASQLATAPGQFDADTLRNTYRIESLDLKTRFLISDYANSPRRIKQLNRFLLLNRVNAIYVPSCTYQQGAPPV